MEQNKKTMRHFYCRDILWDTFEQMANDFDCSIDYLINEAMRHYARSKNYASQQRKGAPTEQRPPAERSNPPPPPPMGAPSTPGLSVRGTVQQPGSQPALDGRARPSQPMPLATQDPAAAQQAQQLWLVFNNQRIAIDKEQFIIGRGSKSSDLAIKDGNISRKHAAVILRNGTYYIKDLGSTNGIDYKGMRIDNKRIDEGDVFHLCDYELVFTYRP
ncbi:MAG: FHA domain-containing protein [Pseudomonadota bacterium]